MPGRRSRRIAIRLTPRSRCSRSARRVTWRAARGSRRWIEGVGSDVYVINGLPLPENFLSGLSARYKKVITVEDGLIGTPESGLRGFAGLVASGLYGSGISLDHVGIVDPRIAPSDHFFEVWEHYGMTEAAIAASICKGGD